MNFKVSFNKSGKIESYTLISGEDVASIDPARFINTKEIKIADIAGLFFPLYQLFVIYHFKKINTKLTIT